MAGLAEVTFQSGFKHEVSYEEPGVLQKMCQKCQKGAMCCRWHCQLSTNSRILRRDQYVMTDRCEKMPHGEIVTRRLNARSGNICTEKLPIQSRVAGSIELDTCIQVA